MLCFAGQTCLGRWVGKLVRRAGAEHFRLGSDHARIGRAVELCSSGVILTTWTWTFKIWRSRTKASFLRLPLSLFEGGLARKLRFRIFHFHSWREVSHESFDFTSCTLEKSRAKASFWHLQLSEFEGKSRIVMAASRLLGAAAAVCVLLFSFAAGHRKSYWCGSINQGCDSVLSADFLNFGAGDFPFKVLLKSASKSYFPCFGVEIRFWSCNFWRCCA